MGVRNPYLKAVLFSGQDEKNATTFLTVCLMNSMS